VHCGPIPAIRRLLHSDWSKDPGKRWSCWAERRDEHWQVFGPARFANLAPGFFAAGQQGASLAGFDFPIGVPIVWADRAGIGSFIDLLAELDSERWARFFDVAEAPDEIAVTRPFYPNQSRRGVRRASLTAALGVADMAQLLRQCDRGTADRPPACCLFWTLGGKQVGKAALSGWREVVIPARANGGRLWPFDGSLRQLASASGLIIAETYPAEAYRHVGIVFRAGMSKRRQADRQANAAAILHWAAAANVSLDEASRRAIHDGFGAGASGEDQFDAMVGLAGMIEVVDGRRAEAPYGSERCPVEGWILGQVV
jgi:hypothetical protein